MMSVILAFLRQVGLSFVPLFVAVDAVGSLPFILVLTQDVKPPELSRVIRYAMFTALGLGVGFILVGRALFHLLGIGNGDFLIAGGIVLLVLAIRHLLTGSWVQLQSGVSHILLGIVPIGTPLVVGPAVLTTLLLLTEQHSLVVITLALVLNLALAWVIFSQAKRIGRLLGESGLRASSQIASLLLAAIAVTMMRRGVLEMIALLG